MIVRLGTVLPLLFLLGCGGAKIQEAEVSGTVNYQGRPLPGGTITFVSARGLQNSAVIDSAGHFHVKAPLGPTKVTVDNRMLRKDQGVMGPRLRPPAGAANPTSTVTGTYLPLPPKYLSVEQSDLACEVHAGMQTIDFTLQGP